MKLLSREQMEAQPIDRLEDLRRRFEDSNSTQRADYPTLLRVIALKRSPLKDHDRLLTVSGVTKVLRQAAARRETVAYKQITDSLGCRPFNKYR